MNDDFLEYETIQILLPLASKISSITVLIHIKPEMGPQASEDICTSVYPAQKLFENDTTKWFKDMF